METLVGFVATNCGETRIDLELEPEHARLTLSEQWMGREPSEIVLVCKHRVLGSHSGCLILERAQRLENEIPLPPSDGVVVLEYLRVPPQPAKYAGSDSMAASGHWTDPFTFLLWLHRDAIIDDGTDLPADEYQVAPALFRPVVDALAWLESPWKLGPVGDAP